MFYNLGKEPSAKETDIMTKENVRGMDSTKTRSPTPDKRESKKSNVRKSSSAPALKQDLTLTDPKILRRPPLARQSMAMSVAHIGMPGEHGGKIFYFSRYQFFITKIICVYFVNIIQNLHNIRLSTETF